MEDISPGDTSFKINTRRAKKSYPIVSSEISAIVGATILENFPNLKVNLTNPEITINIELRNFAYVYSKEYAGPGGLPPASAGRAVLLLSGGIDSPVAGYLAAKRGVALTAVYFHAPPYTTDRAKEKVLDLAQQLSLSVGKLDLMVISITDLQLKLTERCPPEKITILLKRSMLRIADKIADNINAKVLITGDSIGQVASQTLHSIAATNSASNRPIIRPLACFDKFEITTIAQKIGTYEISIRPYDDCCTLFLPKHPETKPKESIIVSIEKSINELEELMEIAIKNAENYQF